MKITKILAPRKFGSICGCNVVGVSEDESNCLKENVPEEAVRGGVKRKHESDDDDIIK